MRGFTVLFMLIASVLVLLSSVASQPPPVEPEPTPEPPTEPGTPTPSPGPTPGPTPRPTPGPTPRPTPRPRCLANGSRCRSDGSLGICCSRFCFQARGQRVGVCRRR